MMRYYEILLLAPGYIMDVRFWKELGGSAAVYAIYIIIIEEGGEHARI